MHAAPADTSRSVTVNIISAFRSYGVQTDSGMMQRMVGNVQLQQGDTYMSCDSAWLNLVSNYMEAFGNVRILQPAGTQVTCDYLRYRGNQKLAYLRGNVSLTDGKSNLWSEDLSYNVGTKVGTYENGGTLQNDATTLSSTSGMYNTRTKDARFKGEVMVNDPEYEVTSEDLGYNTGTKEVRFFAPSVVVNDKSRLTTSQGTYDSKSEIAHFTARSTLQNGGQFIEADLLDYDRNTGWGKASGHVVAIDTEQHATMWSGYAAYNEISLNLFATVNPVLLNASGSDSLYIAADTFFSAPQVASLNRMQLPPDTISNPPDSAQRVAMKPVPKSRKTAAVKTPEQNPVNASEIQLALTARTRPPQGDSTAPRYYIGYKHVRIWSDSLQGICDSISYSARDSVMKMMQKPVAWSRESQISGDTILMFNDSSRIKRLYVPVNALIVSRTGPEQADLFDQVQGKSLNAYFKEKNKIDYMIVFPAAESIYFPKDDSGAYLGVNQAESERMKVFFDDGKIRKIIFEQEVKQKMSPLDKVSLPAMRLSRYQWLQTRRPKSKEELFPAAEPKTTQKQKR